MKKSHSLFFAFIITLLIAINFSAISILKSPDEKQRESVTISRVLDGDTVELTDGRTIRLLNINAPEKNSPLSKSSTALVSQYKNKTIEIEVTGEDKYQRTLARIYTPEYLNLKLVEEGLASKFLVEESELSLFSQAEEKAIISSAGIWKKSSYFGCIKTKIDEKNEIINIESLCNNLNISNWLLKDESRKQYSFKGVLLKKIRIHSSNGKDNTTDLFWNSKTAIWNNDRDTLYFFDEKNNIVHFDVYGY